MINGAKVKRIEPKTTAIKVTDSQTTTVDDAPADGTSSVQISGGIKDFNLLIDFVYDIVINDATLHPNFQFTPDQSDKTFSTWFQSDNVYQQVYKAANQTTRDQFDALRKDYTEKIKALLTMVNSSQSVVASVKKVTGSANQSVSQKATDLVNAFANISPADLKTQLADLMAGNTGLSAAEKLQINSFVASLQQPAAQLVQLLQFYNQLQKSDFKDFH